MSCWTKVFFRTRKSRTDPKLTLPIQSPSKIPQTAVARLDQKNEDNRKMLITSFLENRQQSFYDLWPLLNSKDNQVQCSAAYLLGARYSEACVVLSQVITLKDSKFAYLQLSSRMWGQYPAAEALAEIGKPSTPFMLLNLATSDDELVRDLSLKVIRSVEGAEVAQFIVELAINKEEISANKKRLQAAKVALSTLKSGLNPDLSEILK